MGTTVRSELVEANTQRLFLNGQRGLRPETSDGVSDVVVEVGMVVRNLETG